jgi:hypothetical protein
MQTALEKPLLNPKYYIIFLNKINPIIAKKEKDYESYFSTLENSLIKSIMTQRKDAAIKIQSFIRSKKS